MTKSQVVSCFLLSSLICSMQTSLGSWNSGHGSFRPTYTSSANGFLLRMARPRFPAVSMASVLIVNVLYNNYTRIRMNTLISVLALQTEMNFFMVDKM